MLIHKFLVIIFLEYSAKTKEQPYLQKKQEEKEEREIVQKGKSKANTETNEVTDNRMNVNKLKAIQWKSTKCIVVGIERTFS